VTIEAAARLAGYDGPVALIDQLVKTCVTPLLDQLRHPEIEP
jgi:hypothetical protein